MCCAIFLPESQSNWLDLSPSPIRIRRRKYSSSESRPKFFWKRVGSISYQITIIIFYRFNANELKFDLVLTSSFIFQKLGLNKLFMSLINSINLKILIDQNTQKCSKFGLFRPNWINERSSPKMLRAGIWVGARLRPLVLI